MLKYQEKGVKVKMKIVRKVKSLLLIILIFLFIPSFVFAQRSVTMYPTKINGTVFAVDDVKAKFIDIAATTLSQFDFIFPRADKGKNFYSGFNSYVATFDTASTGNPSTGSVTISWQPLFYDPKDDSYEVKAFGDRDTTDIIDTLNWVTTHSDTTYSVSKVLNMIVCDGVRIRVHNNDSAGVGIRNEMRAAEDSK